MDEPLQITVKYDPTAIEQSRWQASITELNGNAQVLLVTSTKAKCFKCLSQQLLQAAAELERYDDC